MILIQSSLFFFSCKKESVPLFSNCAVYGYVSTQDGGSGGDISVIAIGPNGQTTARTDETGHYFMGGLGEGTYTLKFKKNGYGEIKMYDIQLFGGDTASVQQIVLFQIYDISMPQLSNVHVESDQKLGPDPYIVIESAMSFSMDSFKSRFPMVLYFSSRDNVSYEDYDFTFSNLFPFVNDKNNIVFIIYVKGDERFKTGSKLYFKAYIANPAEYSAGYFDSYLGFPQYSTLLTDRHSEVMSFVVP